MQVVISREMLSAQRDYSMFFILLMQRDTRSGALFRGANSTIHVFIYSTIHRMF